MRRTGSTTLLGGLALFCASLAAAAEVPAPEKGNWLPGTLSGNVGVVTDYSFRGISRTGKNVALQGGVDWEHDSGLFTGMWASSIDLGDDAGSARRMSDDPFSGDAYLEQDFYGGYGGRLQRISYSVTAIFFFFPGDERLNYWEFLLAFGYDLDWMSVRAGFVGSPDYLGTLDTGIYATTGLEVPIPLDVEYFDLTVDANGGYTHTDRPLFADHHYFDWNTGLVVALPFNLSLDFRYVGTDVKNFANGDDRFVFGANYSF